VGQTGPYKLTFEHAAFKNSARELQRPCRYGRRCCGGYFAWDLSRPSEEGDDRQNQKDHKKNFRDPGGGPGDSTKTEDGSNQCDNQENNGVVEHGKLRVEGES
jgi:hypothetical protein